MARKMRERIHVPERTNLERVKINLNTNAGREAWLKERQKAIGGS